MTKSLHGQYKGFGEMC